MVSHSFCHALLLVGLYSPIGSAVEYEASVLRSIHSYGELKGALVDRQHAQTRVVLWAGDVSYSLVSGFGICGAARSSDQGA